ncbi:MAG TPA: tetratricopeptide repeat protein [Candidatus Acidoferrum sp.]|nr:tetratricopeptide repeat protein [Candidatus Acidoferrum sp.]
MADTPLGERQIPAPPADEPRLESWGEIAAYLRREIRTVQRWEKYQGLPVRRLLIGKLGSVYAYRSELDRWYRERQPQPENAEENSEKFANVEAAAEALIRNDEKPGKVDRPSQAEVVPPPRAQITRLQIVIALAALIIVAAGVPAVYLLRARSTVHSASDKIRLVVLPFANLSGDSEQDYFSAGLTDEMITQLGRLDPERLGVIAAETSKISARKPIGELGRALNVQYALEGSVRRGGNEVRINVQLIQLSDQTHVWANSYTGDLRDILHVQDQVAAAVANQIRVALPVGTIGVFDWKTKTARAVNPAAYEAYLRGRLYWTNRGDLHKGIEAYQQAIDKDPNFALAYAGLARAYALLGQVPYDDMPPVNAKPKARRAAERALQLDPQLGEAHSVLANVSFSYDWDFGAAEREFQRAFTLNPNDATAHLWFSHYNMMRNHLAAAMQENSRTLDLDPVSPLFNTVRAEIYYNSRQYDSAIDQARRTIEQYPTYWLTYIWLGSAYREKKMYAEALQQFSEARKLSSDHPAILALYGHALALAGNSVAARKTLAELHLLARSRYISSLYFAAIYTGLGEKKTALDWLDKAYAERNDRLLYLNVDPMADPLRSEPRFVNLMKRLKLP